MLQILERKYPAPRANTRSIIVSVLFGAFIALFLIFFEPFDIDISSSKNKKYQLLFFGLITTLVLTFFQYLLPKLLPKIFMDVHWRVKHQILFLGLILFTIATCNGLYTNHVNSLNFSWSNYWWIISRTFVLGGIPISFITLLDHQRREKLNSKDAREILKSRKENSFGPRDLSHTISSDLKDEKFTFQESDFHYAKAVGNYIDMFIMKEDLITTKTYRITLASFERQLDRSQSLKRCHRSYMVNLEKVTNISGNAQGLRLEIMDLGTEIPVSRKYIPLVRDYFQKK